MTPTATQLQARLDDRLAWFHNQWLFKWHFIGKDGPVEIDEFRGGMIRYGGLAYFGTTRDVFWDAITRGVRKEIGVQLAWVDEHVRRYNRATSLIAIDEYAGLIASFSVQVRRAAVAKDRILRGNGVEFPPLNDSGRWEGTTAVEIQTRADSLKASLPEIKSQKSSMEPVSLIGWRARATRLWNENQWWLPPIAFAAGLVGLVVPFL